MSCRRLRDLLPTTRVLLHLAPCNPEQVDGVYDSDPMKNPDAKRYQKLSYKQVRWPHFIPVAVFRRGVKQSCWFASCRQRSVRKHAWSRSRDLAPGVYYTVCVRQYVCICWHVCLSSCVCLCQFVCDWSRVPSCLAPRDNSSRSSLNVCRWGWPP